MIKTMEITAKCSDMFGAQFYDEKGVALDSYDGYVPKWFPNPSEQHFGDYVSLKIDIETGQILNWKKPTQDELKNFLNKEE